MVVRDWGVVAVGDPAADADAETERRGAASRLIQVVAAALVLGRTAGTTQIQNGTVPLAPPSANQTTSAWAVPRNCRLAQPGRPNRRQPLRRRDHEP